MIHVLATIELQPHSREAFLGEFRRVVPAVLLEDGCLEYGAAVDVPTGLERQAPIREDFVVIIEKWRDRPALERHLEAPHMHAYRERIRGLVRKATLRILAPAS